MCRPGVAACADGFYGNQSGATSDADCSRSPVGYESRAGSIAPQRCRPGNFAEEEGLAQCKACQAGSYQDDEGASACKACEEGSFCKASASAPLPVNRSHRIQGLVQHMHPAMQSLRTALVRVIAVPGWDASQCIGCCHDERARLHRVRRRDQLSRGLS